VRSPVSYSLMLWLLAILCPAVSPAQETGITRKHHPWGCFEMGAWRRVREVTQTFDNDETRTNTTETKTTLQKLEADGAGLLVETVREVGGKRIDAGPQTIKQGWHGELAGQDVKVTHPDAGEVVIRALKIPCRIEQLDLAGPASKTTTKIYYSDTVEPFILKRESVETDLEGNTIGETTAEVVDVDVPCRILAIIRNTFLVKAVHTNAKGTTTTLAFTSTRVPGGVIRRTTKQCDATGRLIRQSSLELLDYGLGPEEEWIRPFGHKRPGRVRQPRHIPPYRPQRLPRRWE
jgi:hypothetical protein